MALAVVQPVVPVFSSAVQAPAFRRASIPNGYAARNSSSSATSMMVFGMTCTGVPAMVGKRQKGRGVNRSNVVKCHAMPTEADVAQAKQKADLQSWAAKTLQNQIDHRAADMAAKQEAQVHIYESMKTACVGGCFVAPDPAPSTPESAAPVVEPVAVTRSVVTKEEVENGGSPTPVAVAATPVAAAEPAPTAPAPPAPQSSYAPSTSLGKIGALGLLPSTVQKLDWNEGILAPPLSVRKALTEFIAMDDGHYLKWYPHLSGGDELQHGLAAYCNVERENILITNGSDGALVLIAQTFLAPGKTVLAVVPTYEHFCAFAGNTGASLLRFQPSDVLTADTDELADAILHNQPDMVYLVSPNNPTGVQWKTGSVSSLASKFPATIFIVDEAYYEFGKVDPEDNGETLITCSQLPARMRNVIVTRTFSKAFCLASLRCGYAIVHPETMKKLKVLYNPKSVNAMAQTACAAALRELATYYKPYAHATGIAREHFAKGLAQSGFRVKSAGAGNFVAIQIPGDFIKAFCTLLEDQQVFIRDISGHWPEHVRISIGRQDEMEQVLEAMVKAYRRVSAPLVSQLPSVHGHISAVTGSDWFERYQRVRGLIQAEAYKKSVTMAGTDLCGTHQYSKAEEDAEETRYDLVTRVWQSNYLHGKCDNNGKLLIVSEEPFTDEKLLQGFYAGRQGRALDVGCNTGRNMHFVHKHSGHKVECYGLEYSLDSVEIAANAFGADRAFWGDASKDFVAECSWEDFFNFVHCTFVFQHMPPEGVDAALKNISRCLCKGGEFMATFKDAPTMEQLHEFGMSDWTDELFIADLTDKAAYVRDGYVHAVIWDDDYYQGVASKNPPHDRDLETLGPHRRDMHFYSLQWIKDTAAKYGMVINEVGVTPDAKIPRSAFQWITVFEKQ